MPTKFNMTIRSRNLTGPVNALFVGNRTVSDELVKRMNENGYSWECIGIEQLDECIKSRRITGSVIIDAALIPSQKADSFIQLFRQLDQQDISTILFNCPDYINPNSFQLASKVDSLTYEEIWGRIESNIKFFKRLQTDLAKEQTYTCQMQLNKDTAEQLEMAGRVQRNFLPARLPHLPHIRWASMFRPAEWVSGDIYDIARLDENYVGFYLADAVGHSMPAALLTMFLKQAAVMRQTINDDYYIFKPWEVVTTLNRRMAEQELAGCLFATCFYGLLNIHTLELSYARAGHPYPVLIRQGKLLQLESRGGLLGIFPEAEFEQKTIQLTAGDKLFLFSDGGEPLIGNSNENGQFHFSKQFCDICEFSIDEMFRAFESMATDYHFSPAEIDDVTAIGLEIQ